MSNIEDAIYHEFAHGPLTLRKAIGRLVSIGYLREDAEDLADEWATELSLSATERNTK